MSTDIKMIDSLETMRIFVIDKVFVQSEALKTLSCFEIETDDLLLIIALAFSQPLTNGWFCRMASHHC